MVVKFCTLQISGLGSWIDPHLSPIKLQPQASPRAPQEQLHQLQTSLGSSRALLTLLLLTLASWQKGLKPPVWQEGMGQASKQHT